MCCHTVSCHWPSICLPSITPPVSSKPDRLVEPKEGLLRSSEAGRVAVGVPPGHQQAQLVALLGEPHQAQCVASRQNPKWGDGGSFGGSLEAAAGGAGVSRTRGSQGNRLVRGLWLRDGAGGGEWCGRRREEKNRSRFPSLCSQNNLLPLLP